MKVVNSGGELVGTLCVPTRKHINNSVCNMRKVTKMGSKSVRLRGRTRLRIADEWAFYAHSLTIGRGSATVPPSVATLPISSPQDFRRLAGPSHAHSLFALLMRINHIIGVAAESGSLLSGRGRIPQAHHPFRKPRARSTHCEATWCLLCQQLSATQSGSTVSDSQERLPSAHRCSNSISFFFVTKRPWTRRRFNAIFDRP